jgi:hypothetical protein
MKAVVAYESTHVNNTRQVAELEDVIVSAPALVH